METVELNKLLLNTAVCCMACDGDIDPKEVTLIRDLFSGKKMFSEIELSDKLNSYVTQLQEKGKDFFKFYFKQLEICDLSVNDELSVIDIALKTINADNKVEYSEIKFFKIIRHYLKISDEQILSTYPDIEFFLEQDIKTETYLDKINENFFETANEHQFKNIVLPNFDRD